MKDLSLPLRCAILVVAAVACGSLGTAGAGTRDAQGVSGDSYLSADTSYAVQRVTDTSSVQGPIADAMSGPQLVP